MAFPHHLPAENSEAKLAPDHPLAGIIHDAYRAFDTRTPADVEVCTYCCMSSELAAKFFCDDARDLPLAYLREWFDAAASTDGISKGLQTYLMPRNFEVLAAGGEPNDLGLELVFARFDAGNSANWPERRWAVIDRFQRSYLARGFASVEAWAGNPLDEVLCMFCRGGWPLDELIEQVLSLPDEAIAKRLWCDWVEGYVAGSIWMTAFWENHERPVVFEFYTSPVLRTRMEALALSNETDAETAKMASDVIDTIDMHA